MESCRSSCLTDFWDSAYYVAYTAVVHGYDSDHADRNLDHYYGYIADRTCVSASESDCICRSVWSSHQQRLVHGTASGYCNDIRRCPQCSLSVNWPWYDRCTDRASDAVMRKYTAFIWAILMVLVISQEKQNDKGYNVPGVSAGDFLSHRNFVESFMRQKASGRMRCSRKGYGDFTVSDIGSQAISVLYFFKEI